MSDSREFSDGFRPGAIIIPTAMLGGVLAAGLMIAGSLNHEGLSYEPIPEGTINNIEFLTATGENISAALQRVCSATGCNAGTLHPMITSSAAAMTAGELELALDAQSRIMTQSQAALSSTTDEATRRILSLEIEVASRIAELYRTERANR